MLCLILGMGPPTTANDLVVATPPAGVPVELWTAAGLVPPLIAVPAVLLVHEWWGLNDQIKSVARRIRPSRFPGAGLGPLPRQGSDNRGKRRRLHAGGGPCLF
ncbi:MAG: hypothetical protein QF511_03745 [Rhodospirillales bacterium]|nr:hypothetical protein [Rhodospirillales bacterium]HJP53240.1 hypothetical protein [Rhodospirillales bacterium]